MAAIQHPHLLRHEAPSERPQLVVLEGGRAGGAARAPRPDPATIARRRRTVAAVVLLAVAAFGVLTARLDTVGRPEATPRGELPAQVVDQTVHVVQPGETLWDIAEAIAPDADPRVVVAMLVERNGSAPLEVGQRLVLP